VASHSLNVPLKTYPNKCLCFSIPLRQKSFASGSSSLPFLKLVVLGNLSKELPSTQVDFIYRRVEVVLLQEGRISSVTNKEISKLKQGKGLFWLCCAY